MPNHSAPQAPPVFLAAHHILVGSPQCPPESHIFVKLNPSNVSNIKYWYIILEILTCSSLTQWLTICLLWGRGPPFEITHLGNSCLTIIYNIHTWPWRLNIWSLSYLGFQESIYPHKFRVRCFLGIHMNTFLFLEGPWNMLSHFSHVQLLVPHGL